MNILLGKFALQPIKRISEYVDKVSMGDPKKDKLKLKGNDEISSLNTSFGRIQISLQKAVSMVKNQ